MKAVTNHPPESLKFRRVLGDVGKGPARLDDVGKNREGEKLNQSEEETRRRALYNVEKGPTRAVRCREESGEAGCCRKKSARLKTQQSGSKHCSDGLYSKKRALYTLTQ